MKRILSKEELTPKMLEGIQEIAGVVKKTLGPGGLPIIIERIGQQLNGDPLGPKATKDGVSVADECGSSDPEKDLIIQSVKAICRKTNTVVGDGTTTAIVLGESILNQTLNVLSAKPELNPQLVRESVEAATKKVIEMLKEKATPVKDTKTISEVATISANGDTEIGELIGKAFEKVGAEGVVTVDEGSGHNTTLEVVEGYQIQRGAEARDQFFNNRDRTQFEAEKVKVLIFDGKLLNYNDILKPLETIVKTNKGIVPPVLIMANEFSNQFLQWLLIQRAERAYSFIAVKGPHTSHVRSGYYDDMAAMLGATKFGNGGKTLSGFEPGDEGQADRVVVDKYTTTFYGGAGSEKDILDRVKHLQAMRKQAESPYDAQVFSDRLAALTSGIAKIGVGGVTELEIREKYDRIEDALNAARAAIQEGVVPGGGTTLLRIATELTIQKMDALERTIGEKILASALKAPFYQILDNIGYGIEPEQLSKIIENETTVFDARNKVVVDALEAGIIDPVKVTRTALENATSIAALLSTAGGGIIYERKKEGQS